MSVTVAAVDLGATSGRVMLGRVGADELRLESVARFPNNPVETIDGLHWNILELYRSIVEGLRAAGASGPIASIGIDSWAVDYALLRGGRLLGTPYHYRDARMDAVIDAVHRVAPFSELYAENGLQFLSFNTLYQYAADRAGGVLHLADESL
ncbi:MAG: rhamnulokinase, partial [Microbacterium sp.]